MPSPRRTDLTNARNFLHCSRLVDLLIQSSGLGPDDLVVEIGPGRGIITERLAGELKTYLARGGNAGVG
jgi:16S rRNA A1518/A1519 N6-dimethyltransferase RsmA/KsgA/DIM1 with predicted DNA glycosylase/AP lyase activity